MFNMKRTTATIAACTLLAVPAFAEQLNFTTDLSGQNEVPANDSQATGTADVTVDTEAMTVSWKVDVQDLSGDAVAAHVHGPAATDENAPPVIDMSDAIMEGDAEITQEQIDAMKDGKYYVNVHTEKFPDGEVRGQLEAAE